MQRLWLLFGAFFLFGFNNNLLPLSISKRCLQLTKRMFGDRISDKFHDHPVESLKRGIVSDEFSLSEKYPNAKLFHIRVVEHDRVLLSTEVSWINPMIHDLRANGGEMRLLTELGFLADNNATNKSYFRVDDEGQPILALARDAPRSHVEHEFQHYLDWKAARNQLMKKFRLTKKDAGVRAFRESLKTPLAMYATEHNAVWAQLVAESKSFQAGYEAQTLVSLLHGEMTAMVYWGNKIRETPSLKTPQIEAQLRALMRQSIFRTVAFRQSRIEQLRHKPASATIAKQIAQLEDLSTLGTEMQVRRSRITYELFQEIISDVQPILSQAIK